MKQGRHIPQRKCVGCQQMKEKPQLLRVLRRENGSIVLDLTGKVNGRGAYLCRSSSCLETAMARKGLERSLGQAIGQETYEALKKEIEAIETG